MAPKSPCLFWADIRPPKEVMLESEPPGPQNVTLYGASLCRFNQVRMRSLGWALIQHDQCPYKTGRFGRIHVEERQCEGRGLKGYSCRPQNTANWERRLEQVLPCISRGSWALPTSDPRLPASRAVRRAFLVFNHP